MDKYSAMFGPDHRSARDDFSSPVFMKTVIFLALFAA
jgi:hypothetical protein